jgi:hypothetical protein
VAPSPTSADFEKGSKLKSASLKRRQLQRLDMSQVLEVRIEISFMLFRSYQQIFQGHSLFSNAEEN